MVTEFGFIGWCNDPVDNHDKVWGYFYRPTPAAETNVYLSKNNGWNCCIFWARRGKAMQFKADVTGWYLDKLVQTKRKKGYEEISSTKLLEIWPSFKDEMEMKLSFEVLVGN